MSDKGFRKLYWGFLFIMLDFRLQGFDVFPDIAGYTLIVMGLDILAEKSTYFEKAKKFSVVMVILSLFSIYEKPAQGGGIQFGPMGFLGLIIAIAALAFDLLSIYNLFMGIKDMAREQMDIFDEADRRWNQYLLLQLAAIFAFLLIFVPPLAFIYIFAILIVSIILMVAIMKFMTKCGENLK